jgi:hypothetical protein
MKDITTPYRRHEFFTPNVAPFDSAGPLLWPTLVGTFLRPIIEAVDMDYWFCNHGADFQFCFAHDNYKEIEDVIELQKKKFQTVSKAAPMDGATIGTAFRGTRWITEDKIADDPIASKRSGLVLALLHSTSALYFDSLVQEDAHWKIEPNTDKENPLGNNFESLLHLISNISQAQFEVFLSAHTAWMQPPIKPAVRCNL